MMRRFWQEFLRFLVYGGLALGLVALVAHGLDRRVAFPWVGGHETEPVGVLYFGPKGEEKPLPPRADGTSGPRNLILLIADGLGFAQVQAARSELVGVNGRLAFERMPVTGWLTTHSATSLYTDSAASATSLATGFKTRSGRLGVDTEGQPLRTLLEAAHERGLVSGLVTDSYLWDATIAAFLVHVESRRDHPSVLSQMASSGASLLLGGVPTGLGFEDPLMVQAFESFSAAGFEVDLGWDEIEAGMAKEGRWVGLLRQRRISLPEEAPSLRRLAEIALGRLQNHENGFILVIETEETDTASHQHDYQRLVTGIDSFSQVVETVLDFAQQDGETLVVMTSDHETGGLLLHGGGANGTLRNAWGSTGHTAVPVPLYAEGPGSEWLGGVRDNTEVAPVLARLLGLEL